MLRWYYEVTLTEMFCDEGYSITCVRMALGWWCNAYSPMTLIHPKGALLASGNLDRCIQACEVHRAGEVRGKGKRQFRVPYRERRPSRAELASRPRVLNRRCCL